MDGETTHETTTVPVRVPQSEDHAPTPAQPASAPVAEPSGESAEPVEPVAGPSILSADPPTTNGVDEAAPTDTKPAETAPEPAAAAVSAPSDDAEMKDAPAAAPAEPAAPETNGTPASKGKRKSTGGVPEHKNKKLNKKKSMPKMTNLDAKPGEYYFARLKSYAPWPSIICDEDMLPQSLLGTRPVTTKREDGTYRDAYQDGGKKVAERTFPVMFLHTNEFAWMPNTDLTPLTPDECKDVSEKGKSKTLIAAYQVAAEGHDLQYFKDMLFDHAKAVQEDEERQAELEAAKEAAKAEKAAEKAAKKKRKSEAAVADDDIEMGDADGAGEKKKSSKKRKKEAESGDEEEKPAKTPKTTKLKLTNKTPATADKKTKEKASKPKSDKKKNKSSGSDEDMADAEPAEPEKPVDPVEARKAREKEVLFLRHKLQKGFLSRDAEPQEDEMPQMSSYIKKLENYPDLEVSVIRTTKINKVLKALIKLNTIPKDEEFNFRSRSMDLLTKWNKLLGTADIDGEASGSGDKKELATNGVHKDDDSDKPKSDTMTPKPSETAESAPAAPETEKSEPSVEPAIPAEPSAPAPVAVEPTPEVPASEPAPEPVKPDTAAEPTAAPAPAPAAPVVAADAMDITQATE